MKASLSLVFAGLLSLPVSRAGLTPDLLPRQYPTQDSAPQDSAPATGDRQCGRSMCVSASKNGTSTTYVLESLSGTPGWMAMGFGSRMAGATIVMLWQNSDGTITISPRTAGGEFMPDYNPSPAQVPTLSNSLSATSGTVKYAFTLPADSTTKQGIIYAYGSTNPGSPSPDATVTYHIDKGTLTLDLSKSASTTTPSTGGGSTGGGSSGAGSDSSSNSALNYALITERMIIAHAVMSLLGFLLFLPAGVLLARFFRTSTSKWFFGHWLIQFYIAGPLILVGFILGIAAVNHAGAMHLNDTHKRWGIVLFGLYVLQCSLGAFIHFIKLSKSARRLPQNYLHAIIGLTIIGLALFQVRTGYREEWPLVTGRPVSNAANIIWYVWVVLIPVLYAIGLAFLPRQYKQEAESRYRARRREGSDTIPMKSHQYT